MFDATLIDHMRENPDDLRVSIQRLCDNLTDHADAGLVAMLETLWADGVITADTLDQTTVTKINDLKQSVAAIKKGVSRLADTLAAIAVDVAE